MTYWTRLPSQLMFCINRNTPTSELILNTRKGEGATHVVVKVTNIELATVFVCVIILVVWTVV